MTDALDKAAAAVDDASAAASETAAAAADTVKAEAAKAADSAAATTAKAADTVKAGTAKAADAAKTQTTKAAEATKAKAAKAADSATAETAKAVDTVKAETAKADPPPPRSMDEIEAELEATRERLAGRIDDLTDYVKPASILERQKAKLTSVFVDEYGGIKPDRVLMAAGVVVALIGLGVLRSRRRHRD